GVRRPGRPRTGGGPGGALGAGARPGPGRTAGARRVVGRPRPGWAGRRRDTPGSTCALRRGSGRGRAPRRAGGRRARGLGGLAGQSRLAALEPFLELLVGPGVQDVVAREPRAARRPPAVAPV